MILTNQQLLFLMNKKMNIVSFNSLTVQVALLLSFRLVTYSTTDTAFTAREKIDVSGFFDSSHHWYDIEDQDKVIKPLQGQRKYSPTAIDSIAANILLYQRANGGWPKNYDMLAALTDEQVKAVLSVKGDTMGTTFDNGTTHSQVEYLARAFSLNHDVRYRDASLRGIDFILSAQYRNGGWPQFYPDTSGYRKYITFNDDAMLGIMRVLYRINQNEPNYSFVDNARREKVRRAYEKGLSCILKCQILEGGVLKAWGQQHDNLDFRPQSARNFEPACISSLESASLVLFLMDIENPDSGLVNAINAAVRWFEKSKIPGTRLDIIKAPTTHFLYQTSSIDRVVVNDPGAPPIWTRFYELVTNRPMFCNRDKKVVYSLAEVERERRVGYRWYEYDPALVLKRYPEWEKKWSPNK